MKKTGLVLLFILCGAFLSAQSIVSIAKKNRKDADSSKPAKVYTNVDLKNAKGNVTTSSIPSSDKQEGANNGEKQPTQTEVEKEYKGKLVAKYREIQNLELQYQYAALEARNLEYKFYQASDGLQREREIKPAWDNMVKHRDEMKELIQKAENELNDLLEEARQKNVPREVIDQAKEEGTSQAQPETMSETPPPPAPPKAAQPQTAKKEY